MEARGGAGVSVMVWVLLTLLSGLLGAELVAWSAPLQRALIRRAAAVLPKEHASRYIEEWYAELEELPDGPATRLLWVMSLVFRRGALARELGVSRSIVGFSGGLKRTLDLTLTASGLVAASPLLLAIGIAIKLTDRGPIFSRQVRIGHDGTTFTMLKFRTMHPDAEKPLADLRRASPDVGLMFRSAYDPRTTWVGRFLRKYSLDELPQLFNVMGGEMSVVGPRPPLPDEAEKYDELSKQKLLVTPGLTGLWQVSGRSLLSWDEMNRLDLLYAKHWTLRLDLVILWRTVLAVWSR